MAFAGTFGRMIRDQGSLRLVGRRLVAGHLDNDLYAALVSHIRREQLAYGGGQCELAAVVEGEGLAFQEVWLDLVRGTELRALAGLGAAQERACRFGDGGFVGLAVLETISDMSNGQLIARPQPPELDALPVDANAIGAAQVLDHDLAALLHHAAVVPRDAERIEAGFAPWVSAHHHHGTVQHDVWTFIEGHQSCGHCTKSLAEANGYEAILFTRQKAKPEL
jgi:hypothetical protein